MRLQASAGGRSFEVEVQFLDGRYLVVVGGRRLALDPVDLDVHRTSLLVDGRSHELWFERGVDGLRVHLAGESVEVSLAGAGRSSPPGEARAEGPQRITAPMPGRIVQVLVRPGQAVQVGQGLVVVEAMKMENELRASHPGRVREVSVSPGAAVEKGALLAVIE